MLTLDQFADLYARRLVHRAVPVAPDDTALLLIDMQRCVMPEYYADFGASRGLAAEDVAHALEEMRGHREATNAAAVDVLAAARSAGIRPIHVRIRAMLADGADTGRLHASKGFRMLPDLDGARYLEGLEPIDGEISLDKTCSGAVIGTNVDRILRNLGIRHVLVMGYYTDQCVSSSVRDLADLGYEVEVVEDACGALTPTRHEQALGHLRNVYAATERSEQLIARMAD